MKKIIAAMLVIVMALALVACGASAEMKAAAGKWNGVQSKFVGDEEWEEGGFSLDLTDDGKARAPVTARLTSSRGRSKARTSR